MYCPGGTPGGLGVADTNDHCLYGNCGNVTPMAPAGMTKVGESPSAPFGAWNLGAEADKKPLYKKWQFWASLAGGAAVVGTGTYLFAQRHRRRHAYGR